jgi:hypothetical protein
VAKNLSKAVTGYREHAQRHRSLAMLYDRAAAQQSLADNLEDYGTRLDDVRAELARLTVAISELEKAEVTDVQLRKK